MGSKVLDASTLRGRFHNVPNRLGGDSVAPYLLQPTDSPEDHTAVDTLNSLDGRIKANAAIVPAGTDGDIGFARSMG